MAATADRHDQTGAQHEQLYRQVRALRKHITGSQTPLHSLPHMRAVIAATGNANHQTQQQLRCALRTRSDVTERYVTNNNKTREPMVVAAQLTLCEYI